MPGPIRWQRGEPGLCRELVGALGGGDGSVLVLRNRPGRRRLLRVRLRPAHGDAADLPVKHDPEWPDDIRYATRSSAGYGWVLPSANGADSIASGAPVCPFLDRAS